MGDGKSIELPFEQFMEMVMNLRETNQAKVKDVMNTWMQIKMSTNRDIQKLQQALNTKTDALEKQVSTVLNEVRKIASSSTQSVMKTPSNTGSNWRTNSLDKQRCEVSGGLGLTARSGFNSGAAFK